MIEYKLEYCRKRNRLINLRPNQLFPPVIHDLNLILC
jgi:hypothetical protein